MIFKPGILKPGTVATPLPAASLVLVDTESCVLMGRRPARSRFAPDAWVFPGGRVDPADRGWGWGNPRYRRAAVRETFEETGLTVAAETLYPLGEAITPAESPIRFHARFFLSRADKACRAAPLVTNGEFVELVWLPMAAARGLPLMDVTELMLDEAAARLAGQRRRPLLLTYDGGVARIRRR